MLYQATHTTRYRYEAPVSQSLSESRLTPRSFPGQRLHASRILVDPEPALFEERTDYFGNQVTMFAVLRAHERMVTTATSVIEVEASTGPESTLKWEAARDLVAEQPDAAALDAFEFVFPSAFVPAQRELHEFAKPSFPADTPLLEAAANLSHRVHQEFKYVPESTAIEMPLLQILKNRKGVCQDFAHIMIGALRSHGIPARYVSGYLRSGANYQGAEASHAWVAVYLPDAGWVDFDPTNDVMPSDGHVTLAWGRDYGDVTPLKGIALGGGAQTIEVEVRVEPLELPKDS
jgi:transglutaminase-like putative cysteine protease